MKPCSSATAQAKLEQQEAQIRDLQGSLRQMELERARQQAELDTLSRFCAGGGAGIDPIGKPLPTDHSTLHAGRH